MGVLISLISLYLLIGLLLYIFQRKIIFIPDPLPKDHKFKFKNLNKELFITTTSGNTINTLFFTPNITSKGLVFYHHGNSHNLNLWGLEAKTFTDRGYSVLMYDYPKYGKSVGSLSLKKILTDAHFLLNIYAKDQPKIINYGRSLGTGIALKISASNPDLISLTILETPYFSLKKMAKTFINIYPLNFILIERLKSYRTIAKVKHPIEIFHGTNDELIPYKQASQLAKKSKLANLTTIEEGTHNDLPLTIKYQKRIDLLLR